MKNRGLPLMGSTLLLPLLLVAGLLAPLAAGGLFKFSGQDLQPGQELAWRFGAVTLADEPSISFLYSANEYRVEASIATTCTHRRGALFFSLCRAP